MSSFFLLSWHFSSTYLRAKMVPGSVTSLCQLLFCSFISCIFVCTVPSITQHTENSLDLCNLVYRRCLCPWQKGWKWMIFKVPFSPSHSVILWQQTCTAWPTRINKVNSFPSWDHFVRAEASPERGTATTTHRSPHSQFKGDCQAADLFWEAFRKQKQFATVSVCCISQTKYYMLKPNSSPFYQKPYEDWESQLIWSGTKKKTKNRQKKKNNGTSLDFSQHQKKLFFPLDPLLNRWEPGKKIYPCRVILQPTCVNHFAPDGQVDMTLFGCLLHKLDHKLVWFPHHRRPIHADQLVTRSQAAVGVSSTQRYNVTDVNLSNWHTRTRRNENQLNSQLEARGTRGWTWFSRDRKLLTNVCWSRQSLLWKRLCVNTAHCEIVVNWHLVSLGSPFTLRTDSLGKCVQPDSDQTEDG